MKALCISLVLTTSLLALTGAGFLTWRAAKPAQSDAPPVTAQLEERFTEILERIQSLESSLSSLRGKVALQAASPVEHGEAAAGSAGEPAPEPARAEKMEKVPVLAARGAEDLRGVVYQFIQEEREERQLEAKQEARARMAERLKETEQLFQGPYGDYNYRVNQLSQKLSLTDPQKQQYYQLLTTYSNRIEEMRNGLDRNNPEVYTAYRDRKKQVQDEFENLVIQSLTPPQAKEFQGLSFSIRSAAMEAATATKEREALAEASTAKLKLNEVRAAKLETAVSAGGSSK